MKANVIHGDFNPCGGAERLSLVTMQALSEMGINFDLTTPRYIKARKFVWQKSCFSYEERTQN
jgi:hypothetical protein